MEKNATRELFSGRDLSVLLGVTMTCSSQHTLHHLDVLCRTLSCLVHLRQRTNFVVKHVYQHYCSANLNVSPLFCNDKSPMFLHSIRLKKHVKINIWSFSFSFEEWHIFSSIANDAKDEKIKSWIHKHWFK